MPEIAQATTDKPDVSVPTDKNEQQDTDVFAWANNLFQFKGDLKFDLFLISKNNVLYHAKLDSGLVKQMEPLFVDGLLEYILDGANEGMVVRGFEEAVGEERVLQRAKVASVEGLQEVMNWLHTHEQQIEPFVEGDHDLKHIKGIVGRVTHPDMPRAFYVLKQLPKAQMLKGEGAWMAKGNGFAPVVAATLRIPADNQLLVLEGDLYVFNESKLERLFGYNAKKNSIAEKKAKAIEANFRLSFAEGLNLQAAIKDNKAVINKLQKIDPGLVRQEDLLNHAEELGIELLVDEEGAIIIMNNKDLIKFVNLLNDDYVESGMTGNRYEIRSKKPLKLPQADSA